LFRPPGQPPLCVGSASRWEPERPDRRAVSGARDGHPRRCAPGSLADWHPRRGVRTLAPPQCPRGE